MPTGTATVTSQGDRSKRDQLTRLLSDLVIAGATETDLRSFGVTASQARRVLGARNLRMAKPLLSVPPSFPGMVVGPAEDEIVAFVPLPREIRRKQLLLPRIYSRVRSSRRIRLAAKYVGFIIDAEVNALYEIRSRLVVNSGANLQREEHMKTLQEAGIGEGEARALVVDHRGVNDIYVLAHVVSGLSIPSGYGLTGTGAKALPPNVMHVARQHVQYMHEHRIPIKGIAGHSFPTYARRD